ncbi:hypothetical protein JJQ59_04635 [Cupriavidus necator]|uniref:Uncharacterized protein n=1 Tax=Cupriavidus necator TaxID=106590 RepID=A0A367PTV7_CUPNE|nr:hypothetical protein [Cupriavidus necator]QQX86137.1 hypothetical protein JJQ59_04635 [Cupriavidus necator]RCJ10325.1 hypothetical protein DDK22_01155 [Cupriavidus necator]
MKEGDKVNATFDKANGAAIVIRIEPR